jgi:hypothetical protein
MGHWLTPGIAAREVAREGDLIIDSQCQWDRLSATDVIMDHFPGDGMDIKIVCVKPEPNTQDMIAALRGSPRLMKAIGEPSGEQRIEED